MRAPGSPIQMFVTPFSDHLEVGWQPPRSPGILVQGYNVRVTREDNGAVAATKTLLGYGNNFVRLYEKIGG